VLLATSNKRGIERASRTGFMDDRTEKRLKAIKDFIWHGKRDTTFIRSERFQIIKTPIIVKLVLREEDSNKLLSRSLKKNCLKQSVVNSLKHSMDATESNHSTDYTSTNFNFRASMDKISVDSGVKRPKSSMLLINRFQ
jgi:hypothetical protein